MKNRSKKGMALASTLLMMTIILMLCVLMLSISLYGSNLTGLATRNFENRTALEVIGNDFLAEGEDFLASYVENNGYKYYNPDGSQSDVATDNIRATSGSRYRISLTTSGSVYTLTVKNSSNKELMTIKCKNTGVGNETNIVLQSWNYK